VAGAMLVAVSVLFPTGWGWYDTADKVYERAQGNIVRWARAVVDQQLSVTSTETQGNIHVCRIHEAAHNMMSVEVRCSSSAAMRRHACCCAQAVV
jgi:hypothetical protein